MGLKDLMELIEARNTFKDTKPRKFKVKQQRKTTFVEDFQNYLENKEKFEKLLKSLEKKEEKKQQWHETVTLAHVAMLLFGTVPVWGPLYLHYMKVLGIW
jgi:nitrate/nitrite-specific signal transduction histidine kinase